MLDPATVQVITAPLLDTGIGREAGFRDDAHLVEAAEAERASWPDLYREINDAMWADVTHRLLFGDDTTDN